MNTNIILLIASANNNIDILWVILLPYAIITIICTIIKRIIEYDSKIERVKSKESVYLSEEQIQKLKNKKELPIVDTNAFLHDNEIAIYCSYAIREVKMSKKYNDKNNIRYKNGVAMCIGEFVITTERVIFLSENKGFEIPHRNITYATAYKNGIIFQKNNANYDLKIPCSDLAMIAFEGVRTGEIPIYKSTKNVDKFVTSPLKTRVLIPDCAKVEDYNEEEYEKTYNESDDIKEKNDIDTSVVIVDIDGMNGHEFEHFCAELLQRNGFTEVKVTPSSGDQGVDVLAIKDGIKYAFQCKNYSTPLGNTPVQEVNAGKVFYKCHVGVVITNSIFTKSAIELAEATNVLLWDRVVVQRMMSNGMVSQQKCESEEIQKLQNYQTSKQYQYSKETNKKDINVKQVTTHKASVKEDFEEDDDYEGLDAEEIATKKLCYKLKKNLVIDMEFWNKMQLDFKCNLVPDYTSLHLNFEIKNKSGIRWNKTEGGITIKANVYNARGKLLAVEDVFISDNALKRNIYSDYIFLDFIKNADRIEVYAYRED